MNKINKVIIITRSEDYLSNGSGPNEEFYGESIRKELSDKTFSKGKTNVGAFLSAMDGVKDWNTTLDPTRNPYTSLRLFMKTKYGISIGYDATIDDAIKELIEKQKSQNSNPPEPTPCYVQISPADPEADEIILLLWDMLKRKPGELIESFGLFLEMLCLDCGIGKDAATKGKKNILYVHDSQIGFTGDEIILDKITPGTCKFQNKPYYEILNNRFVYVASFAHNTERGGIFRKNILQKKFGPTTADSIAAKEATATSFKNLRAEADQLTNLTTTNP